MLVNANEFSFRGFSKTRNCRNGGRSNAGWGRGQPQRTGPSGVLGALVQNLTLQPPRPASQAAAAKSLQSCPTLRSPRDDSPPGSPVPGILQAGTLEWLPLPSPHGVLVWNKETNPQALGTPSQCQGRSDLVATSLGFSFLIWVVV